jgi:hypothetical protein
MSVKIFLSTVSDEFRLYRDQLRTDLTRQNVEVKVQEDFKDLGGDMLDKLDVYIAHCDAVVHLVGDMTGAYPGERELRVLLSKYPRLRETLPALGDAPKNGVAVSYTQWEAWLALYHGKPLLIAKAAETAERGPKYAPTEDSCAAQAQHLARLKAVDRFPGCTFNSLDNLAKCILDGAILDLLVKADAEPFVALLGERAETITSAIDQVIVILEACGGTEPPIERLMEAMFLEDYRGDERQLLTRLSEFRGHASRYLSSPMKSTRPSDRALPSYQSRRSASSSCQPPSCS